RAREQSDLRRRSAWAEDQLQGGRHGHDRVRGEDTAGHDHAGQRVEAGEIKKPLGLVDQEGVASRWFGGATRAGPFLWRSKVLTRKEHLAYARQETFCRGSGLYLWPQQGCCGVPLAAEREHSGGIRCDECRLVLRQRPRLCCWLRQARARPAIGAARLRRRE